MMLETFPSGFSDKLTRTGGADNGRKLFLEILALSPRLAESLSQSYRPGYPFAPVLHWEVSGLLFAKQHVSMGEVVVFRTLCH